MKKLSLFLLLLLFFIPPVNVLAEENAGNYFQEEPSSTENITRDIERDAYLFSQNLYIKDSHIGRSLLDLCYSLNINNSTIGGSIRSLSENLTITDSTIDNNLTVLARSIEIQGNTTFNAIYGACDNGYIGGTTNAVNMAGGTITIAGTVTGDVNLNVNNVIVKSGANIQGTLNLTSENEPIIEDGAQVAHTNFDQVKPEVNTKTPAEKFKDTLIDILYWSAVTLIIAFLIIIFAENTVLESISNLKHRLLALILSGIISLILIPVVCIILILPYVTVPLTLIISTAYVLIASICVPFTAVVAGRMFLPKMNKWLATLIFGLIFGIVSRIPYISLLLDLICMVVMLGSIILKLYSNMRKCFKKTTSSDDNTETDDKPTIEWEEN